VVGHVDGSEKGISYDGGIALNTERKATSSNCLLRKKGGLGFVICCDRL